MEFGNKLYELRKQEWEGDSGEGEALTDEKSAPSII